MIRELSSAGDEFVQQPKSRAFFGAKIDLDLFIHLFCFLSVLLIGGG